MKKLTGDLKPDKQKVARGFAVGLCLEGIECILVTGRMDELRCLWASNQWSDLDETKVERVMIQKDTP